MTQTPAADIVELRTRAATSNDGYLRGPALWAAAEIEALRAANMDLQLHFDVLRGDHTALRRKLDEATDCLHDATCIIGHLVPMGAYALAGKKLVAKDVWQRARDFLASIRGEANQ